MQDACGLSDMGLGFRASELVAASVLRKKAAMKLFDLRAGVLRGCKCSVLRVQG